MLHGFEVTAALKADLAPPISKLLEHGTVLHVVVVCCQNKT